MRFAHITGYFSGPTIRERIYLSKDNPIHALYTFVDPRDAFGNFISIYVNPKNVS